MLIIWTTHREVWFKTLKTSPGGQNGPQCSFGKNGLNAPTWLKMAKTFPKLPIILLKMETLKRTYWITL